MAVPRRTADGAGDRARLFTSLSEEVTAVPLAVEGRLPAWLEGTLVRNGPALFELARQRLRHWFDGQAMLHAFALGGAQVRYTNRFVRGRAYQANVSAGRLRYAEFATDPCHALFARVKAVFGGGAAVTDNASIAVARLGEAYVALTEGALPMRFDPATLETLGVAARRCDTGGGQLTTAHPHVLADGSHVNFGVRFGRRCRSGVVMTDPHARRRRVVAEWDAAEPAYVHSFGLTARHAVVAECPYVVDPLGMLLSGRPFAENFRWRPERGTRFHLIDLAGRRPRVTCEAPPFFAFHHVNAYDDGDAVVVDLVAYEDAAVVDALYLDRLRDEWSAIPPARVTRWRLPVRGGTARHEGTWDALLELPRVAPDRDGRPYRHVYGVGASSADAFLDQLVKLDVETGEARTWRRPRTYAGEPVFVAAPDARAEDDGVLLSVVLDAARGASALVVLDARTMEEVARAEAPHAIPAGFHGEFFADAPPLAESPRASRRAG